MAFSGSLIPNIGTYTVNGLRFGFAGEDALAAENREFNTDGNDFSIAGDAGQATYIALWGGTDIEIAATTGGGAPYIDIYITPGNLFVDISSSGGGGTFNLEGILQDDTAIQLLALDATNNVVYVDKQSIIDEAVDSIVGLDTYVIFDGQAGGFPEQFGFAGLTPSAYLLTPNLTAAGYYEFEFLVFVSTNGASAGLRYQLYTTAGTVNNSLTVYETYPNDIAGTNGICTGDTSDFTTPIDGAAGILDGPNRQGVLRIKGTVRFDGFTPGVIGIQLQSLGGAGSVQIQERSSVRLRQIS